MRLKRRVQSAAAEAIKLFIDKARAANPFGAVPWDDVYWDVSPRERASSGERNPKIWFSAAFRKKTTVANAEQFSSPFGDFVRAYVCHIEQRSGKELSTDYHGTVVRAFRYLYQSFKDDGGNPWELLPLHFDSAINLCRGREARSSAYRVGNALSTIANTMDEGGLCVVRLRWVNPISRDSVDGGAVAARVGKEFSARRNKMLLSEELLTALGHISNRPDLSDADLVRQRLTELLVCGGFRISEVLTLACDCWVDEPATDEYGQPMVGLNGLPVRRCGIRYVPAKGGHLGTRVKWMPSVMVDVAKRAIADVLRLSQPFRAVARFMESHPRRTLLPKPFHLKSGDSLLTFEEVYSAIGLKKDDVRGSVRGFIKYAGLRVVPMIVGGRDVKAIRKSELEQCLIRRSGSEVVFPKNEKHHSLKKCLFVFGVNYFDSRRPTLNGTAALLTRSQISGFLCGHKSVASIFERLNYRDENGDVLKVTSHKFRHWLNTMAEDGGMSQLEIARWFGRRDVGQNSAYQHMTGLQLATSIHEKRMLGRVKGPVTEAALRIHNPIRKAEFVVSSTVTAHMTDVGVCEHNWAALPCDKHRECITCDEHLLEKGNREHVGRTQELRQHAELSIDLARQEADDGTAGANNWLEHQRVVLERANAALAVHADDSIPDGTLVQLPSHKRAGDTSGDRA
ncbi:hypothetical protein [Ralstonia chuxiongensis]|uniref:hypothetical protein n=1 Tax=Ralstonia chuxiongensis TaxID=2957504 RepID=UPI0028F69867|nr:hypothetical protein [Ralstonia chuxiongensis]CAJ0774588.1 hypothetical protein R8510_03945 [Ralstonia chuxiongensis]